MSAELEKLREQNARLRSAWQSARLRAEAYGEGILRVVEDREQWEKWFKQEQEATQHLRARVAELERMKPARFQDCRVCGAGYEYGQPCPKCAFETQVAAAKATAEDPHGSPLDHAAHARMLADGLEEALLPSSDPRHIAEHAPGMRRAIDILRTYSGKHDGGDR
ncbi:hypothetical protein ACFTXJ_14735 [Streptomyces zhihengii]|uniref:hypothetical protein n=1 Tax=Streptomyces zhihengii TaxID=1818004 RepID=UPI00362EDC62